jgi:hypothetical protein
MAESGLRVVITQEQRTLADVSVHGTSVLVGSGGHCDVRLGPDLLALEQLRLSIEDRQVWCVVLARSPAALLGGRPFSSGVVTASDVFSIGRLTIQVVAWHEDAVPSAGHKRFVPLLLLLAAMAGLALFSALSPRAAAQSSFPEPPKSAFAEGTAPPTCPEVTAAAAGVAGGDSWREAVDHRERSPFHPKDGLDAVRAFETAAACFDGAGNQAFAEEARLQATALRAQLDKSFHVHHVRLSHSINQRDFATSKVEVAILKGFLIGRDHPYGAWLDNMERWLQVTQGQGHRS